MDERVVIGEVWNDHSNESYRRDQSHWRGHGRWENDERWRAIGEATVSYLDRVWRGWSAPDSLTRVGLKLRRGVKFAALEWGPGGGANLHACSSFCTSYYGVDISNKNLEECARMIGEEGRGDVFKPVFLEGDPEDAAARVEEPIDLFVSTAVFQHFPSKEYGARVLKTMRSIAKDGATGVIQIRFDNGAEKFKPIASIEQYAEKHITANSYRIDEFWLLLSECRFRPLDVIISNTDVNYAYYFFRAA